MHYHRAALLLPIFGLLSVGHALCQDLSPADFNSDGNVDFHDFTILAKSFRLDLDDATREQGDVNGDGRLGLAEGVAFRNLYGTSASHTLTPPMSRDVALIATERGALFLYSRNNILPSERVVLFGYSVQSDEGSLKPFPLSPSVFDFALENSDLEVTVGSMGPGFTGYRIPMCCSTRLLDARYDPAVGIEDLTFFYGTTDGSFAGPVVPGVPGDANLDGTVDFTDFLLLSSNFGMPGAWGEGDFDDSGDVAFGDFLILSQHYNQSMKPGLRSPVAVPEPSGLVLVFAAIAMLANRRMSLPGPPHYRHHK